MVRRLILAALAFTLVLPGVVRAHPGHDHKIMGTITAVDATHIVLKATDGSEKSIQIVPTTMFKKGKAKGAATDLKVGLRVVVSIADEKEPLKAKEVQYAPSPTTK
ncbi:MAG: hypothetical protein ACRD2N_08290 [Vicinamibacterales bacterium]